MNGSVATRRVSGLLRLAAMGAAIALVTAVAGAADPPKKAKVPAKKAAPTAKKDTKKKDACVPGAAKTDPTLHTAAGVCAPPAQPGDGQKFNTFEDIYAAEQVPPPPEKAR